jgi:hypothetical protein
MLIMLSLINPIIIRYFSINLLTKLEYQHLKRHLKFKGKFYLTFDLKILNTLLFNELQYLYLYILYYFLICLN